MLFLVFFLGWDATPVAGHLHSFGHSDIVYYHVIKALLHYLSHEKSLVGNSSAQANANYPRKALLDKPYFQQRQMHWESWFHGRWVTSLVKETAASDFVQAPIPMSPSFLLILPPKIRNPGESSMRIKILTSNTLNYLFHYFFKQKRFGCKESSPYKSACMCVFNVCAAQPADV